MTLIYSLIDPAKSGLNDLKPVKSPVKKGEFQFFFFTYCRHAISIDLFF